VHSYLLLLLVSCRCRIMVKSSLKENLDSDSAYKIVLPNQQLGWNWFEVHF
jgi:hypothetical protein